jgi:flagellar basal body P-ring formation protein FlgA
MTFRKPNAKPGYDEARHMPALLPGAFGGVFGGGSGNCVKVVTRARQALAATRLRVTVWRAVCKSSAMNTSKVSKFRRALGATLAGAVATALSASLSAQSPTPSSEPAGLEPHARIRAAAEDVVRARLRDISYKVYVHAGDIDTRLHLARCPGPLSAAPMGAELAARTEVRVSCGTAGSGWAIYVPVSLESDINVLVLRESAVRGSRVSPEQVVSQTRREPGVAVGYITDVNVLQRTTLARSLPAGTALTSDTLLADLIVRQGQQVTLIAASPGINVRAMGRMLEDGREGAHVRVQNLASLKVVQGVVDANGVIEVTP